MSGRTDANYKDLALLSEYFASAQQKVSEETKEYGTVQLQLKYISTLEEQNRMLKAQLDLLSANVEANLKLLGQGQAVLLAHQKALEWYLTRQAAGNHGKKHQAELEELGKMLSMFAGPSPETGS